MSALEVLAAAASESGGGAAVEIAEEGPLAPPEATTIAQMIPFSPMARRSRQPRVPPSPPDTTPYPRYVGARRCGSV